MAKKTTTHKPKMRQDWMYDYLMERGDIGYTEMFPIYAENFPLSEQTFKKDWKIASNRYKDYLLRSSKAKDDARLKADAEIAVKALKTKHERLLQYQKLVDECLHDLATGMTNDTDVHEGVVTEYRRKMTITEINQTRRTLRDLQTEISKMEGDYAPTKNETKFVDDFSNMKDDELEEFIKGRERKPS